MEQDHLVRDWEAVKEKVPAAVMEAGPAQAARANVIKEFRKKGIVVIRIHRRAVIIRVRDRLAIIAVNDPSTFYIE